jgi:predicted Zn-dependent peptidase
VLVIGYPGTSFHAADRYALELLQEACSDLGSRLFLRIREKLGLAYDVGAQNFLGLAPGYFAFYVGTEPGKVEQVEQELFAEAETLRQAEQLEMVAGEVDHREALLRIGRLGQWISNPCLLGRIKWHMAKQSGS